MPAWAQVDSTARPSAADSLRTRAQVISGLRVPSDSGVLRRWVGTKPDGRPLYLEFFGDTMLVVNDTYALNYRLTPDSLTAVGDTSLSFRYRLSFGKLLLETTEYVLTMSPQSPLARPLTGTWIGEVLGSESSNTVRLDLLRGGAARWRPTQGGSWQVGEWDRLARTIDLLWLPDSVTWMGQYDPTGNAILFEEIEEGSGPAIFRRLFR